MTRRHGHSAMSIFSKTRSEMPDRTLRRPVSVVLSGIGGMGAVFLRELLGRAEEGWYRIAGTADPEPGRCPDLPLLGERGIVVHPSLESFYERDSADLAIIASPHHFHADQTCLALAHGSDVLCEKPAAASASDVRRMIRARDAAGRWVAVAYQWSFSVAIQALKVDILSGLYGRPHRLKCLYLWPRDRAYYGRNSWAGRKRSAEGAPILDGPLNNAMAHDLHNAFYVLGRSVDSSAFPVAVRGELARANDIENYDTAAVRCRTAEGAEMLFWVSHSSRTDPGPLARYEFERGTVSITGRNRPIRGRLEDGTERDYGDPDLTPMKKLWDCLERAGRPEAPVCGLEAALSQTICVEALQESAPEIAGFDPVRIRLADESGLARTWVDGLDEELALCYERNALPSELGLGWARPGRTIAPGDRDFR
jgi:predicted dehydrogenase